MANLAGLFGCKTESIRFTYLGLPLSITRPKIRDYAPFINHINRRLASSLSFMSLLVAKAVITAPPTFYTGTSDVPDGVKDIVDISRRICVCGKSEFSNSPKALAAWSSVYRRKCNGFLGIINLYSE